MDEQKGRLRGYLIIAILAFVIGWQLTNYGFLERFSLGKPPVNDVSPVTSADLQDVNLDLFWMIWKMLDEQHVDSANVKDDAKVYGAIRGLVDSYGDPYTSFMDPSESKEFTDSIEGKLEGIGAELIKEDGNLVIVTPLKNSPAEKAGLKAQDIILKVEKEYTADMSMFEAIMKIRGEKGTTVNLTVARKGMDKPFEVSIVRDSIDIDSVTMEKLEGGIVYLSVNQFNDKTNDQFGKAVSELILDEPKGLIVDLRFNGGGYLDIAVELLSYLLPSKTPVVLIRDKNGEEVKKLANGNPKLLNVPLVVLVNEGSASASEIVAGAIADQKRGVIMGTVTFGKGTVQEVADFADGSSIRFTIAKWFTPNGKSVDKVGLTPDILVEVSDEDAEKNYDRQKEEAAKYLRGLL
ncbi:S41 family peptidase [Candidatus Peregrinibacteria bacterium]|nr:S41 family peptidase [Candidatus Peregrinibacteria bacterium]